MCSMLAQYTRSNGAANAAPLLAIAAPAHPATGGCTLCTPASAHQAVMESRDSAWASPGLPGPAGQGGGKPGDVLACAAGHLQRVAGGGQQGLQHLQDGLAVAFGRRAVRWLGHKIGFNACGASASAIDSVAEMGGSAESGRRRARLQKKRQRSEILFKIKHLARPYKTCPDLSTALSSRHRDNWRVWLAGLPKKSAICKNPLNQSLAFPYRGLPELYPHDCPVRAG